MTTGVAMEREIREQPALLAANSDRYFHIAQTCLAGKEFDLVLLAARGSSDNAALYARYLIEIHLGVPVVLAAPSVLTRYGSRVRYPKCLAIGVSQSGAAPDVAEVLAYCREAGHATLAITNTEGSRLTKTAEHSILLNAGLEESIAATKTYTASLLALAQVVRALAPAGVADHALPDPTPHLPTEDWLEHALQTAQAASGAVVRCSPVFSLARGYGYATAVETALKLMECALIAAKSYSTADFQHGPRALAEHGTACVVYGELPDGLAETGATVVSAPRAPESPYAPISEILFGQWLALLTARARGLEPDRAQNLSKVTQTL